MPAKVAGTSQEQEKGESSGNRVLPAEERKRHQIERYQLERRQIKSS